MLKLGDIVSVVKDGPVCVRLHPTKAQLVGLNMTSLGIVSIQPSATKLHGRNCEEESQG